MKGPAFAVLACAALAACDRDVPMTQEMRDRDDYIRRLAEREHLQGAWSLMSRADLVFDEGLSALEVFDPDLLVSCFDVDDWRREFHDPSVGPAWGNVPHSCLSKRALPVRWMGPRVLLRVRGAADARLELHGHVNLDRLYTRPRLTVTFDGEELSSSLVAVDGGFDVAVTIPRRRLDGWSDVYVDLSSVHEPWRDPGLLKVARLERVVWEPIHAAADAGPDRSNAGSTPDAGPE